MGTKDKRSHLRWAQRSSELVPGGNETRHLAGSQAGKCTERGSGSPHTWARMDRLKKGHGPHRTASSSTWLGVDRAHWGERIRMQKQAEVRSWRGPIAGFITAVTVFVRRCLGQHTGIQPAFAEWTDLRHAAQWTHHWSQDWTRFAKEELTQGKGAATPPSLQRRIGDGAFAMLGVSCDHGLLLKTETQLSPSRSCTACSKTAGLRHTEPSSENDPLSQFHFFGLF